MAGSAGDRVPTNLIVGFLGSGKTTAISKLIDQRPVGEKWSILVNEFGTVSIDHALVDSTREGVAVEELGGGCACCTLAFALQPLLARFIDRTNPDRLIVELTGAGHPANVVDLLRSPRCAELIDLRNTICLVDPGDFEDVRWREAAVSQDQVQLADIVALNWTDVRDRESIDRCREWVESFRPPKQLVVETSFGAIEPELLDMEFDTARFAMFGDAHPSSKPDHDEPSALDLASGCSDHLEEGPEESAGTDLTDRRPTPRRPLQFRNKGAGYDACGWVFHVDDIFDREKLLDLLAFVHPIVRLKGVFRCEDEWLSINRAKDATSYTTSAYRRDSRLEVILAHETSGWNEFEAELLRCVVE